MSAAAPDNFLEMQILRPCPGPTASETLGVVEPEYHPPLPKHYPGFLSGLQVFCLFWCLEELDPASPLGPKF